MRIAMIIARYPPETGGAELQCQSLSTGLAARGHNITVLTEGRRSYLPKEEVENGVNVIRMSTFGNPPWSSLIFVYKLWKYLRRAPPFDVLHADLLGLPAIFALIWQAWIKTPAIVKTAGAGPTGDIGTSKSILRGHLKLFLFKRLARTVIVPSQRCRKELLEIGIPDNNIELIPNGVDTRIFHPVSATKQKEIREELSLPALDPMAIFAGRWAYGKNLEMVLDTWKRALLDKSFKWKLILIIAGGIPDERKADLEALKSHLFVYQDLNDLVPYYQSSNLAILPSIGEGLSVFLLEAMSCGLSTLTSESASITSASDRSSWGWVIPDAQLSTSSLTEFFLNTNINTEEFQLKGIAARRQVEKGFSFESVAQAYEGLYQRLGTRRPKSL